MSQATRLSFTVPGTPVAKGRPRVTARGGFARAYTPQKTRIAEASFEARAFQYRPATPFAGPLRLEVVFMMPIPKSFPKWRRASAEEGNTHPVGKPDIDNLLKLIADAMSGAFWLDDKQIVEAEVRKMYGPVPQTKVVVTELTQEERTK